LLDSKESKMSYAGFWRRFAASLIDGVILWIPAFVLNSLIPFIGGFVVSLFYKPIFESSPMMATPGKSIMGLTVVSEKGERLSLQQAYIRFFCSFLSAIVLMIGYLMNLFTAKRQTLHDMIAETVVINQRSPEMNYFDVWLTGVKRLFNALSGNAATEPTTTFEPQKTYTTQSLSEKTGDVAKAIEELHKLLQAGAISQEEYENKKKEYLDKI